MSTWRRKALESFPDLRKEIEDQNDSIYSIFFELLPRVREAQKQNNVEELNKIYGFATWCLAQRSEEPFNAAAVAFYEHLVDNELTLKDVNRWISPDMFDLLSPLFEQRMSPEKFRRLVEQYRLQKRTRNKRS